MIPVHIKSSLLKSLNFNEENKSLEIEVLITNGLLVTLAFIPLT